jgi:hypothetical protein
MSFLSGVVFAPPKAQTRMTRRPSQVLVTASRPAFTADQREAFRKYGTERVYMAYDETKREIAPPSNSPRSSLTCASR